MHVTYSVCMLRSVGTYCAMCACCTVYVLLVQCHACESPRNFSETISQLRLRYLNRTVRVTLPNSHSRNFILQQLLKHRKHMLVCVPNCLVCDCMKALGVHVSLLCDCMKALGVQVSLLCDCMKALGVQVSLLCDCMKALGVHVSLLCDCMKALGVHMSLLCDCMKALGVQVSLLCFPDVFPQLNLRHSVPLHHVLKSCC